VRLCHNGVRILLVFHEAVMLYLYARVSTDKQENGRDAQVSRLQQWAADKGLAVDGVYVDEDVSAFSTALSDRKEGKRLWDILKQGDTVVMTKIDRGFRRWADAAVTHAKWKDLGVSLRFSDMDFDLSTPQGELFFSQLVAFSQYESRMHGQRKREVYAHKRQTGQPYNQLRPYGWLAVKGAAGRLESWAPCIPEQELGRRVLRMRSQGMSYPKIALDLCRENVKKPVTKKGSSGYYHVSDVFLLARAAQAGYPKQRRDSVPARVI
jgi:DNA invertase Pin-like site-specific DNA recombinase